MASSQIGYLDLFRRNMVIYKQHLWGLFSGSDGVQLVIYAASSHKTNQRCCEGNMKWINPSKVIHDIASHTLGMVTMIVRPPMSFPPSLSLYLSLFSSETTSHMFANQNRDLSLVATWNNLPKADPLTSLKISFFFNSECSLSIGCFTQSTSCGRHGPRLTATREECLSCFFWRAWLISYWYIMFWMVGMNYDVTSQSHALRLEHTWITANLQDETTYNSVVKASFRDDFTNLVNIQKWWFNGI